eukprot:527506_1
MSTEIVNIIKEINNHVTKKYGDQVLAHLTEKSNAHLLFQRQFLTELDQVVQKLVNNVTASVGKNMSFQLLNTIQSHCNIYNKWKRTKYDSHLFKIGQLESRYIRVIQTAFKQKLAEQDRLFDNALSAAPPANAPSISTVPSNSNSLQSLEMAQNSHLNQINQFLSIINHQLPSTPNNMQIKTDTNPNNGGFSGSSKYNTKSAEIRVLGAPTPSNNRKFNTKTEAIRTDSKAIPAPPKPPLPETSANGNCEYYKCLLCNQQFKDESEWKMHRETHFYEMRKRTFSNYNLDVYNTEIKREIKRRKI